MTEDARFLVAKVELPDGRIADIPFNPKDPLAIIYVHDFRVHFEQRDGRWVCVAEWLDVGMAQWSDP